MSFDLVCHPCVLSTDLCAVPGCVCDGGGDVQVWAFINEHHLTTAGSS